MITSNRGDTLKRRVIVSNLYCKFADDKIYAEIENTESFKQNFNLKCVYDMEDGSKKNLICNNVGVEGNTTSYACGDSTNQKPTGVNSKVLDVI